MLDQLASRRLKKRVECRSLVANGSACSRSVCQVFGKKRVMLGQANLHVAVIQVCVVDCVHGEK